VGQGREGELEGVEEVLVAGLCTEGLIVDCCDEVGIGDSVYGSIRDGVIGKRLLSIFISVDIVRRGAVGETGEVNLGPTST